jgi:N6-adenosine-specific RNA methylase IME4
LKKYKIIYVDPPWTFKTYSDKGKERKSPENHYRCMTIDDIYNLPVDKIADDDCVLFLWVTFPLLQEGLETIKRWGFQYKSVGFNWIKRNKKATQTWFWGLGFWTRSNSELCLLATKGKPKRISKSVHSVVDTPIEKHSKKPDVVRERIVELCGDVDRIELFAREKIDGWDCLGNEIDGKDIRDSLQELI